METGENNPIHIQTENFNIGLASSYHLSIQLGFYHFSYCLLNSTTFIYEYVKKYPLTSKDNTATEITEIINNDAILKAEFSSQSLAFVNYPSTLLPNKLYKKEEAETQLAFNAKVNGTVLADNILSQKAHLIYSVPESILTIVNNFFPKAKYKAQESILIQQYSQLNTEKKKAYLYLNEQKVSPDSIDVTVFGTIEDTDESFSLMYEYIRNIKLGKRPHQFTFPTEFNTLADHKYFGLFTQILCV